MPELPEVETTRRGISPFIIKQTITAVTVRQPQLRFLVSPELNTLCIGREILAVRRRAKYLLLDLSEGYLLNHLGMSGHLRIVDKNTVAGKHDHLDLTLSNGYILRYNDPRRFGLWLYLSSNPEHHRLLCRLGPEPLTDRFDGAYLFRQSRNKQKNIKSFIMTNEVVVGVGNIYATESLFLAGIHPLAPARSLSLPRYERLAQCIKDVLQQAIEAGGTTLRDFYTSDGKPGYFANQLLVYGRANKPCPKCKSLIQALAIGGRNSAFCPNCQKPKEILGNF
ncbi:Formamidopyrimidine-DNA glycosylase [Legionella massiliensis]|uniref:Formamidopyrimidine-DNA glycosylase n=1 Tax=Legionella massiliensis TaxID=1034943 RepID=A0A078KVT0_9GAMM|nr:bifunctional DNA-formamidopyrimidine glycosylase/DNA-(apurinic or apyrimidinic site) lyase [Legionella massiliensis]CDZ75864.1 Formamidopyrimidine-DNA glycosylase [Legionella massiliensis]CEE11602.1 Formamidopyrimidine-DNA glycosylase [Legionella massiliensis]